MTSSYTCIAREKYREVLEYNKNLKNTIIIKFTEIICINYCNTGNALLFTCSYIYYMYMCFFYAYFNALSKCVAVIKHTLYT